MAANLRLVPFREEHLPAYQSWFTDPAMQAYLGPAPDPEWLNHILQEIDGRQYACMAEGKLLAVAGLLFPQQAHPCWVLTDLAVCPSRQRLGWGSRVWQELHRLHSPASDRLWVGYVHQANRGARAFLIRNGWRCPDPEPDTEGMLRFAFSKSAGL